MKLILFLLFLLIFQNNFRTYIQIDKIQKKLEHDSIIDIEAQNHRTVWVGTVYIGNPPQPQRMIFDTGSANIWVSTKDCDTCFLEVSPVECTQEQCQLQDYTRSKSYSDSVGVEADIEFGAGVIKGDLRKETIRIGDIVLKHQTFGYIIEEKHGIFNLNKRDFTGLMGLAFSELNAYKYQGLIESLKDHGISSIGFYQNDNTGVITFNRADQGDLHHQDSSTLVWNKITNKGWWQIGMEGVYVQDRCIIGCVSNNDGYAHHKFSLNLRHSNKHQRRTDAVPDSGTSLISACPEHLTITKNAFNAKIRDIIGDRSGTIDYISYVCKNKYKHLKDINMVELDMPKIGFKFNGVIFYLNFTDIVHETKQGCVLGIMPMPMDEDPFWVLGNTFLMKQQTVFDIVNEKVGIAHKM